MEAHISSSHSCGSCSVLLCPNQELLDRSDFDQSSATVRGLLKSWVAHTAALHVKAASARFAPQDLANGIHRHHTRLSLQRFMETSTSS